MVILFDGLDRLTQANYFDIVDQYTAPYTSVYSSDNKFKEAVQYDVRGNIISLQRNGLNAGNWTNNGYTAATYGLIDNLVYIIKIVEKPEGLAWGANGFNGANNGKKYDSPIELNMEAFKALETAKPEDVAAALTNILSTITHEFVEAFAEDREDFGNGDFGAYKAQEDIFYGVRPGIVDATDGQLYDFLFKVAKQSLESARKAEEANRQNRKKN